MSSGLQASIAHFAGLTSSYEQLLELDRAGWAWEWLRRNPSFASQGSAPMPGCATSSSKVIQPEEALEDNFLRWGLHYG